MNKAPFVLKRLYLSTKIDQRVGDSVTAFRVLPAEVCAGLKGVGNAFLDFGETRLISAKILREIAATSTGSLLNVLVQETGLSLEHLGLASPMRCTQFLKWQKPHWKQQVVALDFENWNQAPVKPDRRWVELAETWIAKAVKKPAKWGELTPERTVTYGHLAGDGYRLHYDPNLPYACPDLYDKNVLASGQNFCVLLSEVLRAAEQLPLLGQVQAKDLSRAVKLAYKRDKNACWLVLGPTWELHSRDAEDALSVTALPAASETDEKYRLWINAGFLQDALSGLKGWVTLRFDPQDKNPMLHLQDEQARQAVIALKIEKE